MKLFTQKDVKSFLRGYIDGLPMKGRGEITRIAEALRVSPTLVSQVLSGEKIFTPEQAQLLVEYLQLTPLESEFLTFLVQKERAGSAKLKEFWESKLKEIRARSTSVANRVIIDRELSDHERTTFYSNPLFAAISLYTSVGDKGQTLESIAERFELTRPKAAAMLAFLVESNLCREEKGRYFMGTQRTHLEAQSPHLMRHHCNWRLRAIQKSEELDQKELMYTSPVSLSRADFDLFREEMVVFIKSFLGKVHDSPAEEIACFNLDFFWIKK